MPGDVAKVQIERLVEEIAGVAAAMRTLPVETNVAELVEFGRRFFEGLQEAWWDQSLRISPTPTSCKASQAV